MNEQPGNIQGQILVVDDEMHLARILQFTLKNAGYEVSLAYDGKEALEMVQEINPDLVILDLVLPIVDGYKVCNKIKNDKSTESIPVIILTARDLESVNLEGDILADKIMQKPFNTEKLLEEIERLVNGSGQESH